MENRQQGFIISFAIFLLVIITTMTVLYTQNQGILQTIRRQQDFSRQRDEVAKQLLNYLRNDEIIRSAGSAAHRGLSEGNELLFQCLHGSSAGGQLCRRSSVARIANSEGYFPFKQLNIPAPPSFAFPPNKGESSEKNCPDPSHLSCMLSGSRQSSARVGYNFAGETGPLSPCYPLEPVVYINPFCGKTADGGEIASCVRALDIEIAFQVIHRFSGESCAEHSYRSADLGSFPRELEFILLPRHSLVTFACNRGAASLGTDEFGNLQCACQFPYVSTGKSDERGVVCSAPDDACRGGKIVAGRTADGQLICKDFVDLIEVNSTPQMTIGTKGLALTGKASTQISCSQQGWLQDLSTECEGEVPTVLEPTEGSSCLLFYSLFKFIKGKYLIDNPPTIYFEDDRPCYVPENGERLGFVGAPRNWLDSLCIGAFVGLIVLGKVEKTGPKKMAKKAVEAAAEAAAKKAAKEAAETGAKKAMNQLLVKSISATTIAAAKETAEKAVYTAAIEAASDVAKEAAVKAAKDAVKRGAKDGGVKAAKEAAEKVAKEAAEKAAHDAANVVVVQTTKKAAQDAAKEAGEQAIEEVAERAVRETAEEAAEKAGREAAEKAGKETVEKSVTKEAAELAAKESAEIAEKEAKKASTIKGSARSLGLIALGGFTVGHAVGMLMNDLPPEIFAASVAQDIAVGMASRAANMCWLALLGAPACYAATILGFAYAFSTQHVVVSASCYPIRDDPTISCTIKGTCYNFR